MCKVFKVSRSGYHDWLSSKPSKRALEIRKLKGQIHTLYRDSKGRYGSPKITNELQENGWKVSRPRVARIMPLEEVKSIVIKKFEVVTTDSKHNLPVAENLLNRPYIIRLI